MTASLVGASTTAAPDTTTLGAKRQEAAPTIQQADLDGLRDAIASALNGDATVIESSAIKTTSEGAKATYVANVPDGSKSGTPAASGVMRLTTQINSATKLCSPSMALCADMLMVRDLEPTTTTVATTTKPAGGSTAQVSEGPGADDELPFWYWIIAGVGGFLLLCCIVVVIVVICRRNKKPKSADPTMDYLDEKQHQPPPPPAEPASRADLMIEFVSDLTSSADESL